MSTLSLHVNYRPLRIAYCVHRNNFDELRKALRFANTQWGGRYNPIVPVDNPEAAKAIVDMFRVDALYPISDRSSKVSDTDDFLKQFPHLPWPFFEEALFKVGSAGNTATCLDVTHPVEKLRKKYKDDPPDHMPYFYQLEWKADDPLSDILLATFGDYPSTGITGLDYKNLVKDKLDGRSLLISQNDQSVYDVYTDYWNPCTITGYGLYPDRSPWARHPGLYIGQVDNFDDIVNYWNLRAAGVPLLFYDLEHGERLESVTNSFLESIQNRYTDDFRSARDSSKLLGHISIWTEFDSEPIDLERFENKLGKHPPTLRPSDALMYGTGITPIPLMHCRQSQYSALGSVSTDDNNTFRLSFQLPNKPFLENPRYHKQHLVVSVRPLGEFLQREDQTFQPPYLPEINKFIGGTCCLINSSARVEVSGLGIITNATKDHLQIRALRSRDTIAEIFRTFGMKVKPSQAGLISDRLIQQMGGLQGCRVFKITGVRDLIENYSPYQSFTRSAAITKIGNVRDGKPHFSDFENLFIEYRLQPKLKPEDAFIYLLNKDVFRVGLNFDCPNCNLRFWSSLNEVKTMVVCEYCGHRFNVTTQLKDRDWAYRRSGLFGRIDNQEGGIPVALTLQQLDTVLMSQWKLFTTGTEISFDAIPGKKCESDLILITQTHEGRLQLLIGECKTRKPISEEDVSNLKSVADAFPEHKVEVFFVFSKLTDFTPEEVQQIKPLTDHYPQRVILLSDRELEPYHVYDRASESYNIRKSVISLTDLALNTHNIYFEPQLKA